jgi:hypothetical protein
MSAGHSLRRQNYSYLPPLPSSPVGHATHSDHHLRMFVVIVSAIALDLATFATVAMLIAGR